MSGASSDPFTYLCARTAATTRGKNQTQKHLIPLFLNTAILIFVFFFLLLKTDEVQLILVSAVILMPGACVFPTTTRGSRVTAAAAAAAGDVGRGRWCKSSHERKSKADARLRVTRGLTGDHPRCVWRRSVTGKLAVGIRGGEVERWRWGWICVISRPAVPRRGTSPA